MPRRETRRPAGARAATPPAFRAGLTGAAVVIALTVAVAAFTAPPAAGQTPPGPFATPPVTITSAGPLTSIVGTRRFGCQATYNHDGQYFPPDSKFGRCGTYIALDDTLYGAAFGVGLPANITQPTPNQAWSQPGVTGTGTAADPFTNKTTTRLPGTDVYVRENVRYVTGENFYRADIIVQNSGPAAISFRLYHAADCHPPSTGPFGLGYGLARNDATGLTTVACAENPGASGGWVQSLVPLSGPNGYQQGYYVNVWGRLANRRVLTNFVYTAVQWDGAMALSWDDTLPAGGQATYSYLAGFSPSGAIPANPLTPLPLPPDEPPPGTPEPSPPAAAPPPPAQPVTVTMPGVVFTPRNSGVAGVTATCRTVTSGKRAGCIIETRRGNHRSTHVLGPRGVARLRERLSAGQRTRLRRDCETDLTLRAVVYQPSGRHARTVARTVRVLCTLLRRAHCASAAAFTAPLDAPATFAELRSRPRPRAHPAC